MEASRFSQVYSYGGVYTEDMVSVSLREKSFNDCNIGWMDPKAFAAAGFFFVGNPLHPDAVSCYSCGVILQYWSQGECPYEEHAVFHPHCAHLYLAKGMDWIYQAYQGILSCSTRADDGDRDTRYYPKCVICLEKDVSCLYLPCSHVATCKGCGATVNRCPICRTKIGFIVRFFLS